MGEVNIPISIRERDAIDIIRKIEHDAYTQGFKDGKAEANKEHADKLDEKLKKAYQDGKAKAFREIQIGKFRDETDKLMWIPGDHPEHDGEYIVSTTELPTPIALSYLDSKWQAPESLQTTIIAFRRMPEKYKGV